MDKKEFEECKSITDYENFMKTSVGFNDLSIEDYEDFMPNVMEVVPNMKEKDPLLMYENVIDELEKLWTSSDQLPIHGPWHHSLVGGILIASLRNNGYDFNENDIKEALKRGMMIPGGSCGFHGACGAGSGAGIALSLAIESTPFHDEARSKALKINSESYRKISELGGPRCCPLSTYTAIKVAKEELEKVGFEIPISKTEGRCKFFKLNNQCHGKECPYFPK